ncbi:SDR family oxidoreductase [Frankia sp. CNm7]|nr:SDR family oxidoreductase [Frankia nepalensis]MBL7508831.1 SDR family oxidoreductase [Frankia nepalensis]MBL7523958.1 SDR family oxidoreductase [Frankia nepalensis]
MTGASGGVGRGIAVACGAAGWEVWIAARRAAASAAVADEVTAAGGLGRAWPCDVTDPAAVAGLVDAVDRAHGRLDALVHNATSGLSARSAPAAEISVAELAEHVAVAVTGLRRLAVAAHPLLRRSGGSVLVTTSEAGFEGKWLLPAYAAAKAAQRGLARVLAREWGPDGIRVNCVAPLADSPAMARAFAGDPAMRERVLGRNPLGRLGDPVADVGAVAEFLISPAARFVTGQTLMADGGSCPIA